LFDQYNALKSFLIRAFNGFKRAFEHSILSEISSNDLMSALVLKDIFDQANDLTYLKEFFVDVNIFTFNCFFQLDKLKKFLDSNKDSAQKINVNIKNQDLNIRDKILQVSKFY